MKLNKRNMVMKNILILTISLLSLLIFSGCEQMMNKEKKSMTSQVEKQPEIKEEYVETGVLAVGAQLYKEQMQQACKMSGYTLARKKSKEEWKSIAESGELAKTIEALCPELKYQNIWTPDIYEYLQRYALPEQS